MKDIGSGLKEDRRNFRKLLRMVMNKAVETIIRKIHLFNHVPPRPMDNRLSIQCILKIWCHLNAF